MRIFFQTIDNSRDAVFDQHHVEVDQQPEALVQSWFPFSIQICLNGREWLCRRLDTLGVAYQRQDNCLPWVEDYRTC